MSPIATMSSTAPTTSTAPRSDTGTMVAVAGTSLHVDDTGEQDLQPVLCLHSLFLDNRMFEEFQRSAFGRFRVIRPEYRGQGRSAAADSDVVTVEQCAGDMAALLDSLGVTRAHLLAASMGGDVAVQLAVARPDLVASVAFLGSSARAEPTDKRAEYLAWTDDVGEHGFTEDRLAMVVWVMFGESTRCDPARKSTVELWEQRMAALPRSLKPSMVGIMTRRDGVGLLADVRAPSLVISGEECPVRPPEWARELADGLPDSRLVMLPAVGHSPLLEAPEVVIPQLLDFLSTQRT